MNFFSSKTLQKTVSVLMLIMVCWMAVPQGVDANLYQQNGRPLTGTTPVDVNRPVSGGGMAGIPPSAPTSNDFCQLGSIAAGALTGSFWSKFTTCASYTMLTISGYFLWFSAIVFNFLIDYTLNMPKFVEEFNIIDVGWGAFRDISLVFFVFIILFIAINMIVGKEQYGSKKLLAQVIVAAILINFSLFFTKVLVDTSNIMALQFYSKIVTSSQETLIAGGNQKNLADTDSGISAAFAHSMGLDQVWGIQNAQSSAGAIKQSGESLNHVNILLVGVLGSVFIIITSIVFLAGGIMMLIRTLALIFLMILSPFAWLGGILPMTKEISSKWWSTLSSNLLYAPVYMMLMYVVMSMVVARGERNVNFLAMFTDDSWQAVSVTAFTFVVLNALMIGCIVVANKAGAVGSGFALSAAKGAAGKMTFGLGGAIGRNTIGRVSSNVADRFASSKLAGTYGGRKLMGALRGTANASFDVRNTAAGKDLGLGKGSEKGFSGLQTDKEKELTEYGKSLSGKAKTNFANKQFGSDKPTLKGLVSRSNRLSGAGIMLETIEEKAKKNRDKLDEFTKREDVKEYRDLLKKMEQGKAGIPEVSRMTQIGIRLAGERDLEFIDVNGEKATYNAKELADGGIIPTGKDMRKIIDDYKNNTSKKYKEAKERGGLGKA